MGYIVIAMPRREDAIRLKQIIIRSGVWDEIMTCTGGNEVVLALQQKDVSLVITTRKLKDMGYEELSSYLPYDLSMILLVKDPDMIPFSSNVVPMELPFRVEKLTLLLRRLLPGSGTGRKARRPKRSPEEQKAIDDAKALLMEQKNLSEPDAFRYIQKNSMDTGKSMFETAQMILLLGK